MSDDTTPHSPYWVAVSDDTRDAARHTSPSAERNIPPILGVLASRLPTRGRALEFASGTGQHAAAFARAFPGIEWQPSDPHPGARGSIAAWIAESGAPNLRPPMDLDARDPGWPQAVGGPVDAIVAINLLHISPWAATEGLLAGAGRALVPGGQAIVYGCFLRGGVHVSDSNVRFDESLRDRNPEWGARDVEAVGAVAKGAGLSLSEVVEMPANNTLLVITRP